MKKTIYLFIFAASLLFYTSGNAQTVTVDLAKAKTTSDADILDAKKNIKPATWQKRGDIYRDIAADQTGIFSKLDSNAIFVSYDAYQKAKELGSKTADKSIRDMYNPMINVGAGAYEQKNLAKALKVFELGQKITPDSLVPFLFASEVGLSMGNNEVYARNVEKALAFTDASYSSKKLKKADFLVKFAVFTIESKDYDKSLAILEKGIQEYPEDGELKKLQAECYLRTGKLEDAIKKYDAIIAKDPSNADNYYNLGIIYEKSGNVEKAVENYNKSIEKDPEGFSARYNLGAFYYNKAVIIVKDVAAMDIKTYQKDGATKEKEALGLFGQACPYFEKLNAKTDLKPDQKYQVLTALQGIYNNLKRKDDLEKVTKELNALTGTKDGEE